MHFLKTLNFFFDLKDKYNFIIIIILLFFAGIFEAASIALILPFITLLIEKDKITNLPFLADLIPNISELGHLKLILFSLSLFFLFYLLKFFYLIFVIYFKNNVLFKIREKISNRLFKNYLNQSYESILNHKISKIISNCKNEVVVFVNSVLVPFVELISEVLTVFFISILIFILNPIPSLILIFISGLLFFCYNLISKKKSKFWSNKRLKTDEQLIKTIQETFYSIQQVILFLKKKYFITNYQDIVKQNTKVTMKQQFFLDIPKYFLELIALISCLVVILLFVLTEANNLNAILPLLGLYLVSAFKMLPSLNRIIVDIQKIRNGLASLNSIYKDLNLKSENTIEDENINNINEIKPFPFFKNIKLIDLTFNYQDSPPLYEKVNLEIKKGDVVGIIGESGSGKSSLANLIAGLIYPKIGKVLVDNTPIQENLYGWFKSLGYMSQKVTLIDDNIENNITFYSLVNKDHLNNIIEICQLKKLINQLPNGLKTQIGQFGSKLSGGQLQRISLARTLYKKPEILILDEATAALDEENEKKILKIISDLKGIKTIIIISHKLNNLYLCDKIYELKNKKINQIYF